MGELGMLEKPAKRATDGGLVIYLHPLYSTHENAFKIKFTMST